MEYGEQLKLEGMELAAAAVPDWTALARIVLLGFAATGQPFTSEDITEIVGLPRGEVSQNKNSAVGALFSHAARAGHIRAIGRQHAKRAPSHAGSLTVWVGTHAEPEQGQG